jgi:competence protein ComEA
MHTLFYIFGLLFLILPSFAHAALVNINTADAALLDTLPGIGPAYAARIIEYRTQHGPFARIEDIQNVSGIGPSIYAGIKALITVGDTVIIDPVPTASSTSSGAVTYIPPPSTISIQVSGEQDALLEVPLALSARATTKNGALDPSARIKWSFGDGSSGEGSVVEKTYRYTGTYLVVVTATDGSAIAKDDFSVTVKPAQARIAAVGGDGITLANDASTRLDLSSWRLLVDTGYFRIPEGTTLLPNASVLLPYTITNLPASLEATLLYPNGIVAARYTPPTIVASASIPEVAFALQPSTKKVSYNQVQKVEPIINTQVMVQPYENTAVGAPAAAIELAAAGAALPAPSRNSGFFHSPWLLGLFGIMVLAGGAFVLL